MKLFHPKWPRGPRTQAPFQVCSTARHSRDLGLAEGAAAADPIPTDNYQQRLRNQRAHRPCVAEEEGSETVPESYVAGSR